jgi:FkbM family methyltransferase
MELLPQLVKPNSEVIDIGANYAYFTERLSVLVGEKGNVIAFEPIPFTYDIAAAVLKKLELKNFTLYKKGVGEKDEKVTFRIPKQDFGAFSAGQSHIAKRNNNFDNREKYYKFQKEETVECEIISIDDFLLPSLKNVSFVKMDIEGAEYFALKGMKKTLDKFRPVIYIEIQHFFLEGFGVTIKQMTDLIKDYGYKIFAYEQTKKQLHIYTGPEWIGNYILIHESMIEKFHHIISHDDK